MGAWETLGIERTREERDIRRAYARKLKLTNPEDDPAGFQTLREAYEQALSYAERGFEFADGMFFSDGSEDAGDEDVDETEEAPFEPAASLRRPPAPRPDAPVQPIDPVAEAIAREIDEAHAALARLAELVAADPPASDAALALGLEALVAAPAMQNLDMRARVERRLARLILDNPPRADGLIPAAIRAMGWKPHGRGPLASTIDEVFDRQAALGYLRELKLKRHPHHDGYRALQAPPPKSVLAFTFRPGALKSARLIIERLENEFPALEDDFPHLAAWSDWLETPRLSPMALWFAAVAAPVIGALAMVSLAGPGPWGSPAGAVAGGLGTLLLAFAHLYLILWPRRLWRTRWSWRLPGWLGLGWIVGGSFLVWASPLAVDAPVFFWGLIGLGVLMVLWTAITGDIDRREAGQAWWLRLPMLHGYYLVWLTAMAILAPAVMLPMGPVLLLAGLVALLGSGSLAEFWLYRLSASARMIGAGLLLGVTALGLVFLWGLFRSLEHLPLVAALAAMATIAARPMAETLGDGMTRVRHWVGWIGLIGVTNLGLAGSPFGVQAFCAWLLAGPLIVGVGALISANQDRRGL